MVVLSLDDTWGYAFLFLAVHVPSYDASECNMCTHRHQVINRGFSLKGHLRTEFCFIA